MKRRHLLFFILIPFLVVAITGCGGWGRRWTSWKAESFGSDWIIVQYNFQGVPFHCWKLSNTSVTNESNSDGIYWKDRTTSHLVHISGWYNRIQVVGGDYENAGLLLGVDAAKCKSGAYPRS